MSRVRVHEVEEALGHTFTDPALIERALTHRSAIADRALPECGGDNEQFEYLGDAVLGMLVSEYLVRNYPQWSEGQLSKSRARLVNASALCLAARRLGLGEFLRLGRGEEKTGGRDKPTLLADAFEAVVAAIYLDAGLEPARNFVLKALLEAAIASHGSRLGHSDYKSALQEHLQGAGLPPARYHVVREAGPEHQKMFWVEVNVGDVAVASGTGSSKKEAEQSAAERGLEELKKRTEEGSQRDV